MLRCFAQVYISLLTQVHNSYLCLLKRNTNVSKRLTNLINRKQEKLDCQGVRFDLIHIPFPFFSIFVNRYHPRDSNGNICFKTTPRKVSVVKYGVFGFCLDSLNSLNSFRKKSIITQLGHHRLFIGDSVQCF